ncbi:MAG: GHMP kinase [Armatimonadetes bacterium]|nr:GHMP kinase [Armatimonadota bacterium]MDE2205545.1 GHMP kinase [Armatimonadota bacterium]
MSNPHSHIPPDSDALEQWQAFRHTALGQVGSLFQADELIHVARAPARLDVMGGVADYSGGIVLEMPLAAATFAAWQWSDRPDIEMVTLGQGADGEPQYASVPLAVMVGADEAVLTVDAVRPALADAGWAAYVAGCFYVMLAAHSKMAEGRATATIGRRGARVLIDSSVPPRAGVASSAALEVAVMHALSGAAGVHPSDLTLAAWCQRVENTIVGAPCGIMDQVACALGHSGALLGLRCMPHDLLGHLQVPHGWRFSGIDSGVKHSVAGSAYALARVGAFMGLKVIQLESGGHPRDNYLCRLTPDQFAAYSNLVPEEITGAAFRAEYGIVPDQVAPPREDVVYRPRACAEHPVLENERCKQFMAIVQIAGLRDSEAIDAGNQAAVAETESLLLQAGELMFQSHQSYSDRLRLGSPETDLLVDLIRTEGRANDLYGARITGGGSGGVVAVLSRDGDRADAAIERVSARYRAETGLSGAIIGGTSPGAVAFGQRTIDPLEEGRRV